MLQAQLTLPVDVRAVLLLVCSDATRCGQSGHRFIVDVLHANRIATLSFGLRRSDGQAVSGMARSAMLGESIEMALQWLARSPALTGQPVALFGLAGAVPDCAAAAARIGPAAIRSLLLLDGRPDVASTDLARLKLPTLLMVGNADAPTLACYRGVAKAMRAPHRLEVLRHATHPVADAGAHEAIACSATRWLLEDLRRPARAGPARASARIEQLVP